MPLMPNSSAEEVDLAIEPLRDATGYTYSRVLGRSRAGANIWEIAMPDHIAQPPIIFIVSNWLTAAATTDCDVDLTWDGTFVLGDIDPATVSIGDVPLRMTPNTTAQQLIQSLALQQVHDIRISRLDEPSGPLFLVAAEPGVSVHGQQLVGLVESSSTFATGTRMIRTVPDAGLRV